MNNLGNNPESKDLKITYPGISVELIPGTKNFYEVVWNCGGLSVAISSLKQNQTPEMLKMVLNIFESVKKVNNQIIFISDKEILEKQSPILNAILKEIFGEGNFRIVSIEAKKSEDNSINGLRMLRTGFVDNKDILNAIAELPNATVLSSIPKSDPRINEINAEIGEFRNTIAGKSLQLLDLNSKKSNQIDLAGENIGYLATANSREELAEIFEKNPDRPLVIKDDEGTAGGTSVNFAGDKLQREAILKNEKIPYPVVIYDFLKPTCILDENGNRFPVQFRPFLNNKQEIMGGTLKFSSVPMNPNLFISGNGKGSFEKQNKGLNTSSGVTNSIFLDENGSPINSYVYSNKTMNSIDVNQSEEFLRQFKLENSQKGLSLGEEILELSEIAISELRKMQERTNKILDL